MQETVFFQASGLGLVLWQQNKLAEDAGLDPARVEGFRGVNLAHNVRARNDVDAIIASAEAAGATVTASPATTFYGGYAGHFTDLDGHAWEIAYNPGKRGTNRRVSRRISTLLRTGCSPGPTPF